MKKVLLLAVVVCLCSTAALALDPMGPPTAGLKQGQWGTALDYAFSETDFEFDGSFTWTIEDYTPFAPIADKLTFEAVEMHKAYLNIGYGIADNWEVFLRLGGARAETIKPDRYIEADLYDYDDGDYAGWTDIEELGNPHDFDTDFAIGAGTKVTLYEDQNLKIGVLGQASWTEMEVRTRYEGWADSSNSWYSYDGDWMYPAEGELELLEIQVALGADYLLSPGFRIYGGPFWYYVDGSYDFKGEGYFYDYNIDNDFDLSVKGDYDVEADSEFGGYLGAQIDVTTNVACNAECMLTGDSIGFGASLIWRH
jgi:opacity protein-like surface antigen